MGRSFTLAIVEEHVAIAALNPVEVYQLHVIAIAVLGGFVKGKYVLTKLITPAGLVFSLDFLEKNKRPFPVWAAHAALWLANSGFSPRR